MGFLLKMTDNINNPEHYNKHKVECIEFARHMDFCLGNAFKYVWRCYDKGKPIEDLNKAIWYLKDYKLYGEKKPQDKLFISSFLRFNPEFKTINVKIILVHLICLHNEGYITSHGFINTTIELINNEIELIKNDN